MITVSVNSKTPAAGQAPDLPPVTPAGGRSFDPDRTLCLAVAYCNPQSYRSRLSLFLDFERYTSALPNVRLFVGELAYGNDRFRVTSAGNPNHLQLRAEQVLWHKEDILNLVIAKRFPANWKYGAYSDGDFNYSRVDLGNAAIQKLQTCGWAQLFSGYSSLTKDHRLIGSDPSFAVCREQGRSCDPRDKYADQNIGACGGGWAFRRDAFDGAGGLMDFCITGSGDWHMAFGLYGSFNPHPELNTCFPQYIEAIREWQQKAFAARRSVGYVQSHAWHYWHGAGAGREYGTRWRVLADHDYNPKTDLCRNADGVLQLVPSKKIIADIFATHFARRNEDAVA